MQDWRALPDALGAIVADAFGLSCAVGPGVHPALAWRRCGLMDVTGRPDGPGLVPPVALTTLADTTLAMLRALSGSSRLPASGAQLLGERACLVGLTRQGAISANGSCRLIACRDGSIALNLPRDEDWDLVAAMVQQPVNDWATLIPIVASRAIDDLIARGRLLGLAIAPDRLPSPTCMPFTVEAFSPRPGEARPLVVDLSSLWAGPLAGALLADAGARVIKVESRTRPDGARAGHPGFFALLNNAKEQIVLDFHEPEELRTLIRRADIIIEGSRPRALRALGIDARQEASRGATWLSITAYGREGEKGEAIGYGDDAAVAGGLSAHMRAAWGEPLFAGDAVADPLTGLVAALVGWAGWRAGGGRLVSLALADIVAFAGRFGTTNVADWQEVALADDAPLHPRR